MHACPGPDRNTKRPAFQLPRGTCDCHVHVFGPQAQFPFSPDRSYTPEDCTLEDLEKRKGSQVAVLIVPTTGEETIEQFSIRVADAWKIGRKKIDDGALLVIAKNDRHLRIEVGYGLEGVLTDATTRRIIDEIITPKFKAGDFAGGVAAGLNRMIRLIDGEQLPAPEPERWQEPNLFSQIDPFNPFLIVAVIVVGGILRGVLGRLLGSLATGGLVAALFWLIAASISMNSQLTRRSRRPLIFCGLAHFPTRRSWPISVRSWPPHERSTHM